MAYTAPKTWGLETVSGTELNTYVRDNLNALQTPDGCKRRLTGARGVANNSEVAFNWNVSATSDWNVGPVWASASGTKFVATVAGVWRFDVTAAWNPNTSGKRGVYIRLNGNTATGQYALSELFGPGTTLAGLNAIGGAEEFVMTTADYGEVIVFQNSGASLALQGNASGLAALTAVSFRLVATSTATSTG